MPPPPPPPPTAEASTASTTPDQSNDHDEREAPAVAGEIRPWDRGTNLYVRGLPVYAHREWLFNVCKRYGWITAIKVKMGSAGCIGSGFVMFETPAEAQRAKQGLMDAGFTVEFAKSIPRCSPKKPATQWSVAFPQSHDYDKQIRITISNLPPSMISKDLFELLLDHDVQFAKIIQNNVQYTGRRSGYAIMATREGALAAVATFNGHFLPGASQPLEVRLADSEDNSPADISDAHSENEQGSRATEPPVASVHNHHYYDRSSSSSTRSQIASSPEPRGSGRAAHRVDGSTFVPITKQVQLRERGEPEAPTAEGRARHHSSEGNAALGSGEAAAAMARETLNQSEPSAPAMNGPSGDSWNSFYGGAMAMFNILSSQMYGNAMTTGMLLPPTAGGTGDPSQVYSVRKDENQQHDNAHGGAAASRLPAMGGGGGGGGDPSLLSVAQPQLSIMPGGMPVHSFGPFGNPGLFSAMGMPVPLNVRGGGPVPQGWPAPPVAYPGIVSAAAPQAAQVQENGYANPSAGQRKSDRTESPRRRRSRRSGLFARSRNVFLPP
ncbi:hypothetical protein DFJ73DRAFT_858109 [Zopfochytrium polystomum]|nr:hypothetical protein DFJ73DRAFT_858109 [Zopfochytrium polystomum]